MNKNIRVGDLVRVENRTFANEVMPPLCDGIVEYIVAPMPPEFTKTMVGVTIEHGNRLTRTIELTINKVFV